jgi:hypothetical protein
MGVYVHVVGHVTMKRGQGGIRARLYAIAHSHHAKCIRHGLPFYVHKGDPDLHMDLYFSTSESAGDFTGEVLQMNRFGCLRNKVECSRQPRV